MWWRFGAVALIFALNGAMFGSWYPYVAVVQGELHLTFNELSRALVCLFAGLTVGALSTRWLIPRLRAGLLAGIGIIVYCGGMALPGQARTAVTLGLCLAVPALGNGLVGPSGNLLGNQLEAVWQRRVQGWLQGSFTAGALLASLAGPWAIEHHIAPAHYFLGVGSAGAVLALAACLLLFLTRRAVAPSKPSRWAARRVTVVASSVPVRPRLLALICVLALAGWVGEGAISDWGGLFLDHDAGATLHRAALGYTAFAGCEAVARMLTDRFAARLDAQRVVLGAGVLALVGAAVFISSHDSVRGVVGAGIFGAGIGPVLPLALSAVGVDAGAVVWVTLVGYLALAASQPVIGLVAGDRGLRFALAVLIGAALLVIALSGSARPRPLLAGLMWRYRRTPGGAAWARLCAMAQAATTARARLRLTADDVAGGVAPLTVQDVRRLTVVDVELSCGQIGVMAQRVAAVRRRRGRESMLALVEAAGHLVALEVVQLGSGPRAFVVWDFGPGRDGSTSIHMDAEAALAAFEASLEPRWCEIWEAEIKDELAALPRDVTRLTERRPRRAPRPRFTLDGGLVPRLVCPGADALQGRDATTVWALPLPDGAVIGLRWVQLSSRSRPQLALLDSREAGQEVTPFVAGLAAELVVRLEQLERPRWRPQPVGAA